MLSGVGAGVGAQFDSSSGSYTAQEGGTSSPLLSVVGLDRIKNHAHEIM
jgi:hypothetical protein